MLHAALFESGPALRGRFTHQLCHSLHLAIESLRHVAPDRSFAGMLRYIGAQFLMHWDP
jgi:hypothetical protein